MLQAEYPALAQASIDRVDQGWDNITFRVGPDHAVRLPRRAVAVPLIQHEQRWLPELAMRLPLKTPVPLHCGRPGPLFPWPWSIVPWIAGTTAESHPLTNADVHLLARTLRVLHHPASDLAPVSPYRGMPVKTRIPFVSDRFERLRNQGLLDEPRLHDAWRESCEALDSTERVWIHGDLHPRNVIIHDNALVGLIDWGDLTAGDSATDLACAWLLIESPVLRQEFLESFGPDPARIHRARGWAIHLGLTLIDSGEPRHVPLGHTTLRRVLSDL